jgi:ribosomal protein S18 acetylase RimI-like enzyme
MAAFAHFPPPAEIVGLRDLRPERLHDLLEDEARAWREELHWDFEPTARMIRRHLETQSLDGLALFSGRRALGYGYYVLEEGKASIGDLFVPPGPAAAAGERQLIDAMLLGLRGLANVRRIETQLMLLRNSPAILPMRASLTSYDRLFLRVPLERAPHVAPLPAGIAIVPWTEARHEEAALLIAACYRNHVDSRINDQYRGAPGARRFLSNILQYPGCGDFFATGSLAAIDRRSGALLGISLASTVAPRVGHITQVCVAQPAQGLGIAGRLLERSLTALRDRGCMEATLTVTASNEAAMRLYGRFGFEVLRRFGAYVWQGWC